MTLRVSDLQSDSNLDSIRNSCDVFILGKGSECALSSLKAQNSRVGPKKDEALYGCFNIKVKKGNPKWTWIYGHRFYPSINPCVALCFLKPSKSLHAVQLCSLKKTSLNSRFINFDEKPVSFKRCRLLWAFENWELAPWEYFFSVFAYFERYKLTAWPIFEGFRSGHSKTSV